MSVTLPFLALNTEMRRNQLQPASLPARELDDTASSDQSRASGNGTQGLSSSLESTPTLSWVAPPSSIASSDAWDCSLIETICQLPRNLISARVRNELRPIVERTLRRAVRVTPADEDCAGGTYFVEDAKEGKMAVFKPYDEEPGAHNNGKGSDETRGKVPAGSGYIREVAAYLLDHDGFAGVPPTTFMRMPNRFFKTRDVKRPAEPYKVGALQLFIPGCRASWDLTPRQFSTANIHRIAILDIRLLNSDRHGGNLLARKLPEAPDAPPEVIPIDHGFTLPNSLEDLEFEWLSWPHSKEPLGEEEVAYVKALDISADLKLLAALNIGAPSMELFKAASTVLKIAVAAGATLRTIGEFMRRATMDQPSALEQLLADVRRPFDEGGALDWDKFESRLREMEW